MSPTKLDEVFDREGHLTEVALTALADGERALLPDAALEHLDGCEACGARLGEQALFSLSLDDALARAVPAPESAPAAFPVAALVGALVLALLGAVPSLMHASRWLPSLPSMLVEGALVALRAGIALLKVGLSGAPAVVAVSALAAVVLAAMGLLVARLAPREIAWKGVTK
jgi:hypothetical protein